MHSNSGNIFLGYQAGFFETGNNKLYIENSNSNTPLLGGDFSQDTLAISGDFSIYKDFKISEGNPAENSFLISDISGNTSWSGVENLNLGIYDLIDGRTEANTSTYLGYDCGHITSYANYNTGIGYRALDTMQGSYNSAFGSETISSNSAIGNIALGSGALSTASGRDNIALGYQAGMNCSSGKYNIFIGHQAGMNENGDQKLYIDNTNTNTPLIYGDFQTDRVIINGKLRIPIEIRIRPRLGGSSGALICENTNGNAYWGSIGGPWSINDLTDANTDDHSVYFDVEKYAGTSNNTVMGSNSMVNNTLGGSDNVSIGMGALGFMKQGSRNVAIGAYAGLGDSTLHSKSGNVFIGYKAGYFEIGNDKLYIENSDSPTPLIGGDFSTDTLAIAGDLSVYGNLKITGGNPETGKVLTSDSDGNASWENLGSTIFSIDDLSDGKSDLSNVFMANNSGLNNSGNSNKNSALGVNSLYTNTNGLENTALGYQSLYGNTSGDNNVAIGYEALKSNLGSKNTAIGYKAATGLTNYENTTTIGYGSVALQSNSIIIGNNLMIAIGGYQNWSSPSDRRFKKNIKRNIPGLDFILNLRPVTYHQDLQKLNLFLGIKESQKDMEAIMRKEKIQYSGFIAQEVEKLALELDYSFSGIHAPNNDKDHYAISYSDFVVPLVKAVQEQKEYIDESNQKLEEIQDELIQLEILMNQLKEKNNKH